MRGTVLTLHLVSLCVCDSVVVFYAHCICTIVVFAGAHPSASHKTQTVLASYSLKPSWVPASLTELKYVSSLKMAMAFSHHKKERKKTNLAILIKDSVIAFLF